MLWFLIVRGRPNSVWETEQEALAAALQGGYRDYVIVPIAQTTALIGF